MHPIIYDVAVSADGFIAGPNADVSKFPHEGPVVDDYFTRLQTYACAIMGRATYTFGYDYGLKPGDNPYPHMHSVVFSASLALPEDAEVDVVRQNPAERIATLRTESDGPIYLCGGGAFAGWMLAEGLITTLRLKRAPVLLGSGTRLFGDNTQSVDAKLIRTESHEGGIVFQEFDIAP